MTISIHCTLTYRLWLEAIEYLWKLIKSLPSVLFRGVANIIDPAYKEMRQHYLNCDIRSLDLSGITGTSYKSGLVNGLYMPSGRHGNDDGFYAPIVFTGLIDSLASVGELLARGNPMPLVRTVQKIVTYIFPKYVIHANSSR